MKQHNPAHPGGFIKRNYLEQLDISANHAASLLQVSPSTLNRLINEKAGLSAEMAIRLSKVFGRSPESWMLMQVNYDLASAATMLGNTKFHRLDFKDDIAIE